MFGRGDAGVPRRGQRDRQKSVDPRYEKIPSYTFSYTLPYILSHILSHTLSQHPITHLITHPITLPISPPLHPITLPITHFPIIISISMSSIPLSSILNPTLFVSRISSPTTGHELNMKMKRCHLQAAKAIFFKRNTAQSILQKGINGYIDLSPLLLSLPLLLIFHSYPSLTPTPSIPHTHSIYPSHPLRLSLTPTPSISLSHYLDRSDRSARLTRRRGLGVSRRAAAIAANPLSKQVNPYHVELLSWSLS